MMTTIFTYFLKMPLASNFTIMYLYEPIHQNLLHFIIVYAFSRNFVLHSASIYKWFKLLYTWADPSAIVFWSKVRTTNFINLRMSIVLFSRKGTSFRLEKNQLISGAFLPEKSLLHLKNFTSFLIKMIIALVTMLVMIRALIEMSSI